MNRNEILPPGVRLDDIDPDVCPRCQGHGEIEVITRHDYYLPEPPEIGGWITCPDCAGVGLNNERTK